MDAIHCQIAQILLHHSMEDMSVDQVSADTPLIDGGFNLASIELLEAILQIERTFGLRLRDEDLTLQMIASFGQFANHVCRIRLSGVR